MNRVDIIKTLKKYNFDPKKYMVIGGAAMVLYGLRDETSSVDITVSKDYLKELLKKYTCVLERVNKDGSACYIIDDIVNVGASYYSRRKDYIEKFPIQTFEDLIKLKQKLNRPKDRRDLKLIFDYISK